MKRTPLKRGTKGLKRVAKHDKNSLTRLHKKARAIFAHWIVLRDKGICFTCCRQGNQCGHFRHGKNMDFSEKGNHCQCVACNLFRSGNLAVYAQKLIEKYGVEIIKELNQEADKPRVFKRSELEEIIKRYAN